MSGKGARALLGRVPVASGSCYGVRLTFLPLPVLQQRGGSGGGNSTCGSVNTCWRRRAAAGAACADVLRRAEQRVRDYPACETTPAHICARDSVLLVRSVMWASPVLRRAAAPATPAARPPPPPPPPPPGVAVGAPPPAPPPPPPAPAEEPAEDVPRVSTKGGGDPSPLPVRAGAVATVDVYAPRLSSQVRDDPEYARFMKMVRPKMP